MKKGFKVGVSTIASLALVSSLLAMPISAYAASGISNSVDDSTNWEVPDSYMTNTVEVDGTLYKVITTWANAWALSGPDYIGVSNSGTINQSGGSSATSDLEAAATTTMLGIWASAVNEVPNAYNWNYFYNLALDDEGEDTDSEQVSAVDVQNGADAGYDTSTGVYGCFKYRPEVIWTSNSLSGDSTITYATQIRNGQYYTDGELVESGSESEYYIDGDENYDPYIVVAGQGTGAGRTSYSSGGSGTPDSAYTLLSSLYILAEYCEEIEAETADYNSDGSITADNVTWKTMNSLPRTTRYEASSENAVSARAAALDVEKLMKGAVYYTLAKIADGTTEKKTVAVVSGTIDTTGSTATVIDYDGGYEGQRGSSSGKIGGAALAIDCLTTDTQASSSSSSGSGGMGGGTGGGGMGTSAAASGTSYTATADELLEADYIFAADGSLSVEDIETWLTDNVTSDESKAKIGEVEILTDLPAFMNGHNFTFEKAINMVYDLCFFYPELFPDLELMSYWYDNVYHVNYDDLGTCLKYGLGNATMPSGVEVTDLPGSSYSNDAIDAIALEGYEYYVEYLADESPYADDELIQPSDTYVAWAEDPDGDWETSAELEAATDALADAEEALTEAYETIDELESTIDELEATIAELEESGEADAETIEELESTIASLEDMIETLQSTIESLESGDTDTITSLTSQLATATSELETANATITSLTEQLETAQAEAASAEEAAATLTTTLAEVQSELETANETITSLTTELAEAQAAASTDTSRAANTMKVKKATKTVKKAKVKKKAVKVKAITVKKAKGTVIYTKTKGSEKLTVNAKTGKITVKKGTKKGTYKVKVKVTALGNDNYKAKSKTVTVKIKVK